MNSHRASIIFLLGLIFSPATMGWIRAESPPLSYERDIRPILKVHCFQCHGEGGVREGMLDLRLRHLIVRGGESGPAIVAGKPGESRLLERIQSGEMPPGEARLSADDVQLFVRWISEGAVTLRDEPAELGSQPYFTEEERSWWSFQSVRRPAVPAVVDPRIQTPIDAFLLERLQAEGPGFGFAPRADRVRLIRRASLRLTGLLPSPEDVAAFEQDEDPLAWQRVIDRLLASPHYGERWGRHWLDAAGYADSEGYTDEDVVRENAYLYRDYVVRSFNTDKRYDQFVVEQLAGDELVNQPVVDLTAEVTEKLAATGFLRMAPDGTGSSTDQGLARNQVIADTIEIVSTSLLGLTIQCAQCHDHRYDPISQLDYYRFRAIFEPALDWKNWKPPAQRQISLYTEAETANRHRIEAEATEVDKQRQQRVDFYIAKTLHHELLMVADNLQQPLKSAYETSAGDRTAEQKKLLNDHPNIGNISAGSLYLYDRRREARASDLEARRDQRQVALIQERIEKALADLPEDQQAAAKKALAIAAENRSAEQKQILQDHPALQIGPEQLAQLDPAAAARLEQYTVAAEEIRKYRIRNELQEFTDKASEIRSEIPRERFLRVLQETPGSIPETFLFFRGDHEQPKQSVQPSSLSILSPDESLQDNDPGVPSSGRRLAWARQLTSPEHPLLARVIVNRIWMHHFGMGLVASPGDLGALGEQPSHPELLDWLAAELIESGWSIKQLHRTIMQSEVYQQSGTGDPELHKADQQNILLGRWPLRRMEGEAIRDSMLTASGHLQYQLYGQPVPVMEDEVGQIVIGKENLDGERKPTAPIDLEGQQFRRSIYIQVRRSRPLAILELFDSPVMTPNCPQRANSNVPPQSLLLMNSVVAIEHSTRFAERLLADAPGSLTEQVDRGWALALGGLPDEETRKRAIEYVERQQVELKKENPQMDEAAVALQSLTYYCHALFSSSRFIYVE